MPLAPGDRFEDYEIRRLLARGRRSVVYEAYDRAQGRAVALKILLLSAASADLSLRARAEARELFKAQHGNLARTFAVGALGGDKLYIAMELLEGRTLREVYRELGRLTPAEMLVVGVQIARGIAAAHADKMVHGDLRPEAVFVRASNEVKVLGLGVARFVERVAPHDRRDVPSDALVYLAPEQVRELGVTPRSDIYALGTILYEGLAGRPPAPAGPAAPLEEVSAEVPRYVARLIDSMVAKEASDRPGSMREVAEVLLNDVRRLLEASSGRPRPLWLQAPQQDQQTPLPATLAAIDPTPPPTASSWPHQAQRPRFRALGVIALFGTVLAGALIAVMVSRALRPQAALVPASVAVAAAQPPAAPPSAALAPSASASALPHSAPVDKAGARSALIPVPAPSAASSAIGAHTRQMPLE